MKKVVRQLLTMLLVMVMMFQFTPSIKVEAANSYMKKHGLALNLNKHDKTIKTYVGGVGWKNAKVKMVSYQKSKYGRYYYSYYYHRYYYYSYSKKYRQYTIKLGIKPPEISPAEVDRLYEYLEENNMSKGFYSSGSNPFGMGAVIINGKSGFKASSTARVSISNGSWSFYEPYEVQGEEHSLTLYRKMYITYTVVVPRSYDNLYIGVFGNSDPSNKNAAFYNGYERFHNTSFFYGKKHGKKQKKILSRFKRIG